MERTLLRMFEESVSRYNERPLAYEKKADRFESLTYGEIRRRVEEFSAGLIQMGFQKGDRAALIAEGRTEWIVAELGILAAGGINVPLSVKLEEASEIVFRLDHSDSRFVITSKSQIHKVRKAAENLPDLEKIILMDELPDADADEWTMERVMASGRELLAREPDAVRKSIDALKESDIANICYTSGTTADPKGIMLSHRNYTANVEQCGAFFHIPLDYCSLLILPWDHAFAHTAGVYTLIAHGASFASVQSGATPALTLRNVPQNILEIRPTFLLSVPALAKNFRKNIESGIRQKGAEGLFELALKTAYRYNSLGCDRGKGLKKLLAPMNALFDKLLFSKIRESFGGRLDFFIGGGALLDIELQRFFYAIGIPMYQGYGLSEASPVISANSPKAHKLGSSGKIVPNLEVKICGTDGNELPKGEKGEIVIKGENVMVGYWKNEKATADTLKDGWLYTGDMGYIDPEDYLYVLGRFKSLLIGSDGEKFCPEGIEEAVTENSPYIDQFMLYNNQSPYTVGLVVPNKERLVAALKDKGLSCQTPEGQTEALRILETELNEYREGGKFAGEFPVRWLPSATAVLGEAFTEQNHLLNSTMKIVRGKITEFYKTRIEHLFTPEGKDFYNHQNRTIIGRLEHRE